MKKFISSILAAAVITFQGAMAGFLVASYGGVFAAGLIMAGFGLFVVGGTILLVSDMLAD
jgi:hypothetical protein